MEKVLTYQSKTTSDKSLLYQTSSDLSIALGYLMPQQEHAMRIEASGLLLSKWSRQLDVCVNVYGRGYSKKLYDNKNYQISYNMKALFTGEYLFAKHHIGRRLFFSSQLTKLKGRYNFKIKNYSALEFISIKCLDILCVEHLFGKSYTTKGRLSVLEQSDSLFKRNTLDNIDSSHYFLEQSPKHKPIISLDTTHFLQEKDLINRLLYIPRSHITKESNHLNTNNRIYFLENTPNQMYSAPSDALLSKPSISIYEKIESENLNIKSKGFILKGPFTISPIIKEMFSKEIKTWLNKPSSEYSPSDKSMDYINISTKSLFFSKDALIDIEIREIPYKDSSTHISKTSGTISNTISMDYVSRSNQGIHQHTQSFMKKINGEIRNENDELFTHKTNKSLFSISYCNEIGRSDKAIFGKDTIFQIDKVSKEIASVNKQLLISKLSKGLFEKDDRINFKKQSKSIYTKNTPLNFKKMPLPIDINTVVSSVSKESKPMEYNKTILFFFGEYKDIYWQSHVATNKNMPFKIHELEKVEMLFKTPLSFVNNKKINGLTKYPKSINEAPALKMLKKNISRKMSIIESILPVKKAPKSIFGKITNILFEKYCKKIFDKTFSSVSKYSKPLSNDTWFNQLTRNNKHKLNLFDGVYFTSLYSKPLGSFNSLIFFKKYSKGLYTNDTLLVNKTEYNIDYRLNREAALKKAYKHTIILKGNTLSKVHHYTNIYSVADNVAKGYKPMVEDLNGIHVRRNYIRESFLFDTYQINRKSKNLYCTDNSALFKYYKPVIMNKGKLLKRESKSPTTINGLIQLKIPTFKNVSIDKNVDFITYNQRIESAETIQSIYSDKPDKYIIDKYQQSNGEDELILSQSDFDYSIYEQRLIINGDINPDFILRYEDDNIYIKYPIENPIKLLADMAVLHKNIPVNTLTYIIKKAYSLWREKIFVYAGMKPDEAARDIVQKTRDNLELQFTTEQELYEALRCVRLFRWYAEMSVLNNSEYMLKLNCNSVTPDYDNVDMNELSQVMTFYNLALTDDLLIESPHGENASLSMDYRKYHAMTISTRAYITNGNLTITINDVNPIVLTGYQEINLKLPQGKNKVHFAFVPNDETGKIEFSQFELQDYLIESYELNYMGKIGEANKTIQYLIDTLVIAEDSIDNIQKNLSNATPVANLLDEMRTYFDLHHRDKEKGKRLITKFL